MAGQTLVERQNIAGAQQGIPFPGIRELIVAASGDHGRYLRFRSVPKRLCSLVPLSLVTLDPLDVPREARLLLATVAAGFPSPAADDLEEPINLGDWLIEHPAASYVMRVAGHLMAAAGITDGDLVVVDRARKARTGHIVVAIVHGDRTLKRLRKVAGRFWLIPEADGYAEIIVDEHVEIWGAREQQAALAVHRARDLLVRQRTMLTNAIRGLAAELGIVARQGPWHVSVLCDHLKDIDEDTVPAAAEGAMLLLFDQFDDLGERINEHEQRILARHRSSDVSRRLETVLGIGPLNATLIAATVADAAQFKSGREFAAWIGLVPREHSSGGKQRLGGVSKRGNPYLRRLLIAGAHVVLRWTRRGKGMQTAWLTSLIERRPPNVVAVAIANKLARIAWALMARGGVYLSGAAAA